MELFKKPKWLKPEIDEPIYYLHIAIIILSIYGLMLIYNPMNNLFIWGIYLIISDGIAHTVLQLD
jgi:hypothetical protein